MKHTRAHRCGGRVGAGSETKLVKPFSVTKEATQRQGGAFRQQESRGVPWALSAEGTSCPVWGSVTRHCVGTWCLGACEAALWGFVLSLRPLRCQVEKPLGGR